MQADSPSGAWLEWPDGRRVAITGNLSFGRVPGSEIVLPDDRVSRRHAIIHAQSEGEYWVVDHGSRNGTYLNDRRVVQPTRLRDRDQVRIGPFVFRFRQPAATVSTSITHTTHQTLVDVRSANCWLLVVDVAGSTVAAQARPGHELAVEMGQFFGRCNRIVEAAGGTINKYVGDGFLAFGHVATTPPDTLARMLEALRRLQADSAPPFRWVLHQGQVHLGGGGSLGEESLTGAPLSFVFRQEKLAGVLGEGCLLSDEAAAALREVFATEGVGEHPLPDFAGQFRFHRPVEVHPLTPTPASSLARGR